MGIAQSRSRGLSLKRGAALVALFSAPFLGFAVPAHGDDTSTDTTSSAASDVTAATVPTTDTTVADGPAPYDGSTPSTDAPTTVATDPPATDPPVTDPPVTDPPVTDPPVTDPITVPPTDPPVTDPITVPPTDPPVTDPITVPATDPPTQNSTPGVVTPPTDPPSTGNGTGSGGTTGTAKGTTDTTKKRDPAPVRVLLQAFTPGSLTPQISGKGGAMRAASIAITIPVKAPLQAAGKALDTLRAQLGASFDPSPGNTSLAGGLGSAAPRFAPWIVLLVMAWLVRTVIASILADRTAGPRRRRWTLL